MSVVAEARVRKPAPLDMGLLGDLPSLTLQARYLMDSFLSGQHRSLQKGSSVDFAEYRDYHFGDDLRRVDWRLFGRTDRLHVKQYEEETQLRVFLVLDASASMNYRSRPELMHKIDYARLALAAIARLAQRQRDAFGLATVGGGLEDFLRARSSAAHWRAFVGRLECVTVSRETRLATTLESLAELVPSRSLLVVASDFYEDVARLEPALRRLAYDHHEVIGLHVLDPMEMDFAGDDAGTFVDLETGGELQLDAPAARNSYLVRFRAYCAELDETFRAAGGELVRFRTTEPPIEALAAYLRHRKQRG